MRFYFKVSWISRFTLRMSIRPRHNSGLGFLTGKNTKPTPSSGDCGTHLVLQVNGEVRLERLPLDFACEPEVRDKNTLSHTVHKNNNQIELLECTVDTPWFLWLIETHRTTRGMLRAQAAEKSGYLKMEGFSAKA